MKSVFKIDVIRSVLVILLLTFIGSSIALIYLGYVSYQEVYPICPLNNRGSGVFITADENVTISDFSLYADKYYAAERSEGFMGIFLQMEINSSGSTINIQIPHEVKWVSFLNDTPGYANYLYKYDNVSDATTFMITYTTSQPSYKFKIIFDWKIENRESYFQWTVGIPIYAYGSNKNQYKEGDYVLDNVYVPPIKNYKIEIAYPKIYYIDFDLTYPTPDYVSFTDNTTKVSWFFGYKYSNITEYKDISSVQAGFLSVEKMNEKDNKLFWSGIMIGLGISVLIQLLLLILENKINKIK